MITSLQNPLVKQLRKLHRAKERQGQGVFLVEGTHLLEVICATDRPIATLCYTETWQLAHPQLWAQAHQRTQRAELVSPDVLRAIATTVEPDGVVLTLAHAPSPPLRLTHLGLALETIQDPGNLGTMIRTAAAVGVEGILLSEDCADWAQPKALRASAGHGLCLPLRSTTALVAELTQYQQAGFQLVATLPTAALTYWDADFTPPTLLLLGNEGAGLSAPLAAIADIQVKIPLAPAVESLNVAIANALILYEIQRQRANASN